MRASTVEAQLTNDRVALVHEVICYSRNTTENPPHPKQFSKRDEPCGERSRDPMREAAEEGAFFGVDTASQKDTKGHDGYTYHPG